MSTLGENIYSSVCWLRARPLRATSFRSRSFCWVISWRYNAAVHRKLHLWSRCGASCAGQRDPFRARAGAYVVRRRLVACLRRDGKTYSSEGAGRQGSRATTPQRSRVATSRRTRATSQQPDQPDAQEVGRPKRTRQRQPSTVLEAAATPLPVESDVGMPSSNRRDQVEAAAAAALPDDDDDHHHPVRAADPRTGRQPSQSHPCSQPSAHSSQTGHVAGACHWTDSPSICWVRMCILPCSAN